MQSQMSAQAGAAGLPKTTGSSASTGWSELWRGAYVIFHKHMYKFRTNSMEIGGTLGWPLLWILTFGVGMERVVDVGTLGANTSSYLAFITPGIIALTALSGAVNSGMTLLEEKVKGILKEYFVAPIPRMSILLASTASGMVKTLIQSLILLVIAMIFGARLDTNLVGIVLAFVVLLVSVVGGPSRPMVDAVAFTVACATLVLGFTALFLRFATRRVGIFDSLTANAYGIYIVHYAFVMWLQYALLGVELSAIAKGTVVFAGALALSWGTVALLRRVPGVARVI